MFFKKKILSAIVAVAFLLVSVPCTSFAADGASPVLSAIEETISQINQTVMKIKGLANSLTEGNQKGTFKAGAKDKINNFLSDFSDVQKSLYTLNQTELDSAKAECQEFLLSLMDYYNYDVVMIDELFKDRNNWKYPDAEGYYTWNEDRSLSLTGEKGRLNHYTVLGYDVDLGEATAVRMNYEYDLALSNYYTIVGFQPVTNGFLTAGEGYNIIFKPDLLEIQKYVKGYTGDKILKKCYNFYILDGKKYDIEIGAFPIEIGTYVYLMVDGEMVLEHFDIGLPKWEPEEIKFVATNVSGKVPECYVQMAAPTDKGEWKFHSPKTQTPTDNKDSNKDTTNNKIMSSVFKDVDEKYGWAVSAIDGLYKKGIISGKTSNTYAPADNVTRAEFTKLIMGVMGFGLKYSDTYFEDVTPRDWYYTHVVAAKTIGLVNGLSQTYFGANEKITRQDAAVIISRAAKIAGKTFEISGEAMIFDDSKNIATYAKEAIDELTSAQILKGSDGKFNPRANCTRAEAAVMLKNTLDKAR